MSYYDRALEMKDELVANRRYLHENAEVGLTLHEWLAFFDFLAVFYEDFEAFSVQIYGVDADVEKQGFGLV